MTGAEQSPAPLDPADAARAADADREAIAEKLRIGAAEGRLDFEELEDRLGQAYRGLADLLDHLAEARGGLDSPEDEAEIARYMRLLGGMA